jgi:flagellar protein FlaG
MEVRAEALQTDVAEAWVRRQEEHQPAPRIRPVEETESAVLRKKEEQEKERRDFAKLGPDDMKELVDRTQAFVDDLNIRLDFEVYEETGDMVIRIFNRETEELVREIPPEELLKLHHRIAELRGVFFDEKA